MRVREITALVGAFVPSSIALYFYGVGGLYLTLATAVWFGLYIPWAYSK